MKPTAFLHELDNDRITAAILAAEGRSRGEIRVHVTDRAVEDVETAARAQFEKLEMTKTALRNGVLIYVAPASQKFAIIGDAGIHEKCGPDFWTTVAAAMQTDFRAARYTEGILDGVEAAGAELARFFPRKDGPADVNELPDDVTRD